MKSITIQDGGRIGLYYLKKVWHHFIMQPQGNMQEAEKLEWKYINGVFNTLGIGLEPTIKYLMNEMPSFTDFEDWIEKNGSISKEAIQQFNTVITREEGLGIELPEKVFSPSDLQHWEEEGYIVLPEAIPQEDCAATTQLIYDSIEADPADTSTWYQAHPLKQGIMIQLFEAPILEKNRKAKRIKLAFEQLWCRADLGVSKDRVSFNPPETAFYQFEGPNLHWDMSLKKPIPFGLQGLLYLTDTEEDQGAFTVIPGFHNQIDSWLDNLPEGTNPRDKTLLKDFKRKPIAGKAGDMIIWNQCLPHGSSPNLSTKPRIVQYINYQPIVLEYQKEWI